MPVYQAVFMYFFQNNFFLVLLVFIENLSNLEKNHD